MVCGRGDAALHGVAKGLHHLVDALAQLRAEGHGRLHLLVVGGFTSGAGNGSPARGPGPGWPRTARSTRASGWGPRPAPDAGR